MYPRRLCADPRRPCTEERTVSYLITGGWNVETVTDPEQVVVLGCGGEEVVSRIHAFRYRRSKC